MKACIITVYNSENCGSYWQAIAMREYLQSCGYEVSFLKRNMKGSTHTIIFAIKKIVRFGIQRKFVMIPAVIRQYFEFGKAAKTFTVTSLCNQSFDLCVLGSDTIWNLGDAYFRNNRNVYWGNTSKAHKTIAYAASIANTTEERINQYKDTVSGLNSLYSIGVRDTYTKKILEKYSTKPIEVVCDPTLLYDKNFYTSKVSPVISKKYIFVYYFQHMPQELSEMLFRFAQDNSLDVVVMSNSTNIKGDLQLNYYSPEKFISYFSGAEYVLTNTYHGTIFTLLFEKQAVFNSDGKKKIKDLLERFGVAHQDYSDAMDINSLFQFGKINYYDVRKKVDEFRTKSIKFLQGAIGENTTEQANINELAIESLINVDLSRRTTFKIGGIAKNFYIPASIDELKLLTYTLNNQKQNYYILSGGSNILINDKKIFEHVIYMGKVSHELMCLGDGRFYIGASNHIQKVIRYVNEYGYGGFEELIGLPALFGGIVYMNAGIGGRSNPLFNIGDFIIRVKALERLTGQIVWIEHDQCAFDYRSSVFQNNAYVILGAELKLNPQSMDDSDKRIKARKNYCKNNQRWAKGCFGSCFSRAEYRILKLFALSKVHKGGIKQADNNPNWLINDGTGTYSDAIWLIKKMIKLHKMLRKPVELEVRVWE